MTTQQQSSTETVSVEQKKAHLASLTSVFAKRQGVVLVNFFAINDIVKEILADPSTGITMRGRDEEAIQSNHGAEAEARGQTRKVIRSHEDDTGFPVLTTKDEEPNEKPGVWTTDLPADLAARKLQYSGGHVQHILKPVIGKDGKAVLDAEGKPKMMSKGLKLALNFRTEGETVPMPLLVQRLFRRRYNDCTVWANLKFAKDGSGKQWRLDTVTFANDTTPADEEGEQSAKRELVMKGNTYRLVKVEPTV